MFGVCTLTKPYISSTEIVQAEFKYERARKWPWKVRILSKFCRAPRMPYTYFDSMQQDKMIAGNCETHLS